ncbi:hypothetical protein JTB14_033801 [Gonioctena quinquepunctata]|nr:hypothetical protein JTB14_033801 [Gonioctena quinquepunctata]
MSETSFVLSSGKPADFSFKDMKNINVREFLEVIGLQGVRYTRVKGVPERGENRKFLTRSILFNNNKLVNYRHIDELIESVLEFPDQLGWIDLSFNRLTQLDECILKFKNLKIIYFHGNCITDLEEVYKLRALKQLRSITFHGNPIANESKYRSYIVAVLPQIANLDFKPVVRSEKLYPAPPGTVKKLKDVTKNGKEKATQKLSKDSNLSV